MRPENIFQSVEDLQARQAVDRTSLGLVHVAVDKVKAKLAEITGPAAWWLPRTSP